MDWNIVAAVGALLAVQTTIILWMMSKLDNDIKQCGADIRSSTADSNSKWMTANAKSDAMAASLNARSDAIAAAINARIDTTQSIIMRMLEKQGR